MNLHVKPDQKTDQEYFQKELLYRRERLEKSIKRQSDPSPLIWLLQQVDAALERLDQGTFGLCQTCHEPIDEERLIIDPLLCFCLDHLTESQQRDLEQDLYLASRIQGALLPPKESKIGNWDVYYSYLPAGPVSGDYCDLIKLPAGNGQFLFALGDVSGKGISASMLMTHLHAMFRSLISLQLNVDELMEKVNRLFCESTLSTSYTTLICGRAYPNGTMELANAGHWPALLVGKNRMQWIDSTGIPLGLFCEAKYRVDTIQIHPGDNLLLYSDGLTEATNKTIEYGGSRLQSIASSIEPKTPRKLIDHCLADLRKFLNGSTQADDLTLMSIQWSG